MKRYLASLTLASLLALPLATLAAETNLLSVHVLNQQTGKPAEGVKVVLEQKQESSWKSLNEATTDENGRIKALWPQQAPATGAYRVTFKTGDYFKSQNKESFFPEIPVEFHISDTHQHYHVPLLLSQYGYSTYRGN